MKTLFYKLVVSILMIGLFNTNATAQNTLLNPDSGNTRFSIWGRGLTGFECGFQQRLSDPVYPAYYGAIELVGKRMVNLSLCWGQSQSVQKRNLFGYDYTWKFKYAFLGIGADARIKMTGLFTLRVSTALYRKFATPTLHSVNQEIVPFLKEPFQRNLSFGLSAAVEYNINPWFQIFLEGGYQVTMLSFGLRAGLPLIQRR